MAPACRRLVHGLAGSGAITTLVFAELDTVVVGPGSIAGMTIASGVAGASIQRVATTARRRRASLSVASIVGPHRPGAPPSITTAALNKFFEQLP